MNTLETKGRIDEWRASKNIAIDSSELCKYKVRSYLKILKKSIFRGKSALEKLKNKVTNVLERRDIDKLIVIVYYIVTKD